jgi:type II secretory pathway component PulM
MSVFDSLRESWEKLSDRERRLLGIGGAVFVMMLVFGALWTTSSALAEVEEERDELRKVLSDIELKGDVLEKRMAERKAIEARFETKLPALAAFVESKAREQALEVRQVVEEPQKDVNGYRRYSVRVSFSGVSLRPVVKLLASIAEERAAIAVDRIQIQHYQPGDSYKFDVGIVGFEPPKGGTKAKAAGEGEGEKAEEEEEK